MNRELINVCSLQVDKICFYIIDEYLIQYNVFCEKTHIKSHNRIYAIDYPQNYFVYAYFERSHCRFTISGGAYITFKLVNLV